LRGQPNGLGFIPTDSRDSLTTQRGGDGSLKKGGEGGAILARPKRGHDKLSPGDRTPSKPDLQPANSMQR